MIKYICSIAILSFIVSCQNGNQENIPLEMNPAAEGFNSEESDSMAISIADRVMEAMGSRTAWDTTDVFQWTFFGRRTHTWDKENQSVQISVPGQNMEYQVNLGDMTGTVVKGGVSYTESDSISHYLEQARRMWINDSYWLFMPFKLKDSGVRLKHVGTDTTLAGEMSDLLEMTFIEVGVTPDNKYIIYVDQGDRLVKQWDFYTLATDSLPRFQSAWPNYQRYGDLKLSGGAINGNNAISNIKTGDQLRSVFK